MNGMGHPQMVYHSDVGGFRPEAERVTATLRDEIIDGRRPPGSRLVERELAAELGVSRVPVREALRNLVGEGLATPRPRSWTVVREFSEADIDDLMEVRSGLETLTAQLAAQRRSATDLSRLGELVERARSAAEHGDAGAARRFGADFHEELTRIAGNNVLSELAAITRGRMRWLLSQHEELVEMVTEHAEIYAAVANANAERAAELARRHLETSRRAARRVARPGPVADREFPRP